MSLTFLSLPSHLHLILRIQPIAFVKRDGVFQKLDAALLVPGDVISLANGAAVPAVRLVHPTSKFTLRALNLES
jgi:magnesium-transporting ATPase (P-type)